MVTTECLHPTRKAAPIPSQKTPSLTGLLAFSLLSGGWLLGYGLNPLMGALTSWIPTTSSDSIVLTSNSESSVKYWRNVPISLPRWESLNDRPKTKSSD